MVVTLTGENSFGWLRESRQLMADFVARHGELALERLDGQEADLAKINEALTSLPFLSDKKMIVLRAPGTNKTFAEQAEQLLLNVPETTDIIIIEPKLDKRVGYYKYLKKSTDFRDFPELDDNGLGRWLVDTAKGWNGCTAGYAGPGEESNASIGGPGASISPADAYYLIQRVGSNQQLLSNELEKLLLYDHNVTRRTIDLLTEAAPQSTIFQLLEAAFAGSTQQALKLYAEQRALKVEPQQIIAMLAWQLHVLAIIKTAGDLAVEEIARQAKINPYVISKSQKIARSLTQTQLKKLVSDLLAIDLKTKRTSIDPDEALQHYLLALAT